MGKHTFFVLIAVTIIWTILVEAFTWQSIATGMFVGMACIHFGNKFLPYNEITNVNFYKLMTYPFKLLGEIYMSGFFIIKVIFSSSVEVEVVTVKTKICNECLRTMLAQSVTLTPGSVLLELKKDELKVLWIRDKNTNGDAETADRILKKRLEDYIIKAEVQ